MQPADFRLTGFDTYINLWPMIDVVTAYAREDVLLYHPKGFTETLNRIGSQIGRLKWCAETCVSHQAWARFDFETTDPKGLMHRLAQTQAKLARIANRYPPRKDNTNAQVQSCL